MGGIGPVEMEEQDSLRTSYSVSGTCGSPHLVARVTEREQVRLWRRWVSAWAGWWRRAVWVREMYPQTTFPTPLRGWGAPSL